jgi:hypothetical protein
MKNQKFSIIRTHSAGVWFGNIKKVKGTISDVSEGAITKETNMSIAVLINARRLWYWSGAASLSQLAVEGTKRPNDCKFTVTITDEDGVYLPQVIEVLPCTEQAVKNIKAVKEWKI